ncbi:MAG: SPASM domain-containing protein [Deltaproteobacteria bacterium]|nr:SPASM domain-containing protein [Deltaproteobacteria bacterium]
MSLKIIQDISSVIAYEKGVLQEVPQVLCEFAGECGNALSVLPNGDIFPCECLVNIPRFKLGNIQKNSLKKIVEGKKFRYFVSEYNKLSNQRYNCRWFSVCKGGCFHRRLPECNGDKETDYFCAGRKALFCHIEKALTGKGIDGKI